MQSIVIGTCCAYAALLAAFALLRSAGALRREAGLYRWLRRACMAPLYLCAAAWELQLLAPRALKWILLHVVLYALDLCLIWVFRVVESAVYHCVELPLMGAFELLCAVHRLWLSLCGLWLQGLARRLWTLVCDLLRKSWLTAALKAARKEVRDAWSASRAQVRQLFNRERARPR